MAIIEVQPKDPITLRVDVIDMGLLHLLETRYVVLIEQRDNDIVIELYKKQELWTTQAFWKYLPQWAQPLEVGSSLNIC